MTPAGRLRAVQKLGFTERQAGFLVTVLLHAGVCVARQYCAYAHIVRGQKVQDFFRGLVEREYATPHLFGHPKARVYHLQHRALYRAVGEPDARFRKHTALGRAIERLMLLDHVLAHRDLTWLATEREKVSHFSRTTPLRLDELPAITFGRATQTTVRHFAEKLPIGLDPDGRRHVFVYLMTHPRTGDFRAFLHRHAELLRALPQWTVHVLMPLHLATEQQAYEHAFCEEYGRPLRPVEVEEIRWFFRQRDPVAASDETRFRAAQRAFGAPRFRALHRAWLEHGERALDASQSPVLADALARRSGQLECHVLPRRYHTLSSLVGTS